MTQPGGPSNNPWQAPNHSGSQPGGGQPLPGQPAPQQPFGAPQPYQQQQGFPAPGPRHPGNFGPEGYIELTLQGSAMTSNMLTPQVQIDGYPVPASYGLNRLPVPAGRHTVSAYATWIVKYGQASYDVDVQPGQSVPVFYAAPMIQFLKGAMGPTKQKRGGKGFFIGFFALVLLLVILVVVIAAVVGSGS
ncbi:hypothetical protein GCM10011492_35060 [Flexivirga endophytica]|uniref:Uncharacterized protein n=1 Tax=Flexivirga endophytica TaxID=1849103 RepID=A0A916TG30_9MICO|nr:hypothetical protein [Flexivirga endophytica]GGB41157.1 hypothetical protein GCM10011492_35060 [Flexivirga endophytica]GHB48990.1 hypothetical protein GCM10008112_17440 [Flexivirga endophytica]